MLDFANKYSGYVGFPNNVDKRKLLFVSKEVQHRAKMLTKMLRCSF
jgi:hypothetical protein